MEENKQESLDEDLKKTGKAGAKIAKESVKQAAKGAKKIAKGVKNINNTRKAFQQGKKMADAAKGAQAAAETATKAGTSAVNSGVKSAGTSITEGSAATGGSTAGATSGGIVGETAIAVTEGGAAAGDAAITATEGGSAIAAGDAATVATAVAGGSAAAGSVAAGGSTGGAAITAGGGVVAGGAIASGGAIIAGGSVVAEGGAATAGGSAVAGGGAAAAGGSAAGGAAAAGGVSATGVGLIILLIILIIGVVIYIYQNSGGSMFFPSTEEGNSDPKTTGFDIVSKRAVKNYNAFYKRIYGISDLRSVSWDHNTSNFYDFILIYETIASGVDGDPSSFKSSVEDGDNVWAMPDSLSETQQEDIIKALGYKKNSDGTVMETSKDAKTKLFDFIFNRMMTYSKSHGYYPKGHIPPTWTDVKVHNMTAEEYIKKYGLTETQKTEYDFLVNMSKNYKKTFKNLDYYDSVAMGGSYNGSNGLLGFGDDSVDANLFTGAKTAIAYKTLTANGLTSAGAAGIMGNVMAECSFNEQSGSKDGYNSYGLCQWTAGRKTNLRKYSPNDWNTLQGQLNFLVHELKSYKDLYKILCTTNDVRTACSEFQSQFERGSFDKTHPKTATSIVKYGPNGSHWDLVKDGQDFFKSHLPFTVGITSGTESKLETCNYDEYRGAWVTRWYIRYYYSMEYYKKYKDISHDKLIELTQSSYSNLADNPWAKKAVAWCMARTQEKSGWHYSQALRMKDKYADCSSYVCRAYTAAGIPMCPNNWAYRTSDLYIWAKKNDLFVNKSSLQPGDLLLKPGVHVEMYIGNGKTIGAHSANRSENQIGVATFRKYTCVIRPSLLKTRKK